ncbi:SART-1 family protein DOT2 [Linum grandiflorum]
MEDAKEVSPDEIIHEAPVGKGLSGALKLLHKQGTLKESINWGDMDRFKDIRIERTDEFGRIVSSLSSFPCFCFSNKLILIEVLKLYSSYNAYLSLVLSI